MREFEFTAQKPKEPVKRFGDFALFERIGSGGMGDVYAGVQESLKRPVAVKLLPPQFTRDPLLVKRFMAEAQHSARLSHPNICQVYYFGESQGDYYIVLEFVDGKDLRQYVKLHRRMAPAEAVRVVATAARALSVAHRAGIIHRDIKPSNIMLARDGTVKVMDFGLAKCTQDNLGLTKSGAIVGTPEYMSPEQWEGLYIDGRTDIYSLGLTLRYLLTGRDPVTGPSPATVMLKHIKHDIEPLEQAWPGLPRALYDAVERMTARQAYDRFSGAADAAEALEAIQFDGVPAQPAEGPASEPVSRPVVSREPPAPRTGITEMLMRWRSFPARGWWGGLIGPGVVALALAILLISPVLRWHMALPFPESQLRDYENALLMKGPYECNLPAGVSPFRTGKVLLLRSSTRFNQGLSLEVSKRNAAPGWGEEQDPPRLDPAWYRLGAGIRATKPSDVETVIFCEYTTRITGKVTAFGATLRVFDWKTNKFLYSFGIEGEAPADFTKPAKGKMPDVVRAVTDMTVVPAL